NLFTNRSSLVLEGVELQWLNPFGAKRVDRVLVRAEAGTQIYIANCRFVMMGSPKNNPVYGIFFETGSKIHVLNSQSLTGSCDSSIQFNCSQGGELTAENCVILGGLKITPHRESVKVIVRRNSLLGSSYYYCLALTPSQNVDLQSREPAARPC